MIFPLADVIASLIPDIMAGGMQFPDMTVGVEMRGKWQERDVEERGGERRWLCHFPRRPSGDRLSR